MPESHNDLEQFKQSKYTGKAIVSFNCGGIVDIKPLDEYPKSSISIISYILKIDRKDIN